MKQFLSCAILLGFLAFFPPAVPAETKAFFSSQESVEGKLVRLIEESHSSIDIALFELKSPVLAHALNRAKDRGVALRLVLDASHSGEDVRAAEGDVRWLAGKTTGGRGVMHNKFALFDQSQVVTGSYNWTPGAEHSNYENALLTDETTTVAAYASEFERLWMSASGQRPPQASSGRRSSVGRAKTKRNTPRPTKKKAYRHASGKSVKIRVLRSVPPKL